MKNNVKHLLFLVCLILAFTSESIGQISKGDYILEFSSSASYINIGIEKPRFAFKATYLRMISDRLMVGGAVDFRRNFNSIFDSQGTRYYASNSYRLSPTFRYYFSTDDLAIFASLKNDFAITRNDEQGLWDNTKLYRGTLGLGVNYPLGNSITLETHLTSNLLRLGDADQEDRYLSFTTGLRIFFNGPFKNNIDSIPEKIYKKGNIQTSASLMSFRQRYKEPSTGHFRLSPNLRYFVSDRQNVYGRFGVDLYKFSTNNQYLIHLGLGTEYIFNLKERLYLNLGIVGNLRFSNNVLSDFFKSSVLYYNIPISASLNYFHNQKRFYLGARYTTYGVRENSVIDYLVSPNALRIFTGVDYFVRDNIYIKGEFDFNTNENSHGAERVNRETLSFSVGFILDRT